MTFEEELERSGKLVYTNKGVSMMPLLRENKDIMIIEKCAAADVKRLDAVLFTRKSPEKTNYVLHRVLKVNRDESFWIVGDNCVSGEQVRGEQILGKLTEVIRDGKRIGADSAAYRVYAHIWCDAYPVRFFFLRARNFAKRCLRYVKRRLKHEK